MPPFVLYAFLLTGVSTVYLLRKRAAAKEHHRRLEDRSAMMKYLSAVEDEGTASSR